MAWDHRDGTIEISLPVYVKHGLQKFQHPIHPIKQYATHAYSIPKYDATTQITVPADISELIDDIDTKLTQEIMETLLYYGRAVNSTTLVDLVTLADLYNNQEKSQAITQILNYCAHTQMLPYMYTASTCASRSTVTLSTYPNPKPKPRRRTILLRYIP